jgi:RimJ/RimL family protein N-acetyltransferase
VDAVTCSIAYPTIATTNLRLREFGLRDIPVLVAIMGAGRTAGTTGELDHLTSRDAKQWIESHHVEWIKRRAVHWAVTPLSDDRLFGYVGLTDISIASREARLSFWLERCIRRGDHAAEVAQGALAFAFGDLHLRSVYVRHAAEDHFAAQLLTRVGMVKDGLRFHGSLREQSWEILKSEWDKALLT